MTGRLLTVVPLLTIAALLVVAQDADSRGDRQLVGVMGGETAFGGGAGGGNPPLPPLLAPLAPGLGSAPGAGTVLVAVTGPVRRVVVLRSRDGRLLDLRVKAPGEALVIQASVPGQGAWLDVLGTEAVAVPVAPGSALRVVTP